MGSGKTSVGRDLAKSLNKTFYDSDQVIEEKTGVDISTIFDVEGEEGFRERETSAIGELTSCQDIVLATGGGTVTKDINRGLLSQRGWVVYLKTSVEQQLARTQGKKNRPLLQTASPQAKLRELLNQREPFYLEIADFIVCTDGHHLSHVKKTILRKVNTDIKAVSYH